MEQGGALWKWVFRRFQLRCIWVSGQTGEGTSLMIEFWVYGDDSDTEGTRGESLSMGDS